jgi:hypothetical protein
MALELGALRDALLDAAPTPTPGYMTYYEHTDLAMLRAYLDETWGLSLPKIPEENGALAP